MKKLYSEFLTHFYNAFFANPYTIISVFQVAVVFDPVMGL